MGRVSDRLPEPGRVWAGHGHPKPDNFRLRPGPAMSSKQAGGAGLPVGYLTGFRYKLNSRPAAPMETRNLRNVMVNNINAHHVVF